MDNSGLEIRPVGKFRRDAAVRFLLAGADTSAVSGERVDAVKRILRARRADETLLWRAKRAGRTVGAALALRNPGRYSMLSYTPVSAPGVDLDAMRLLVGKVCDLALAAGSAFVQALIPPQRPGDAALLESAGFNRLAELIYMRSPVLKASGPAEEAWSAGGAEVTWRRYGQFTDAELARIIKATYENSEDCPALIGARPTADVIASHKADGAFCADGWWSVTVGDQPGGCVLVNDSPAAAMVEVVYLGVVPEFRRRGLGRALLLRAIDLAAARGKVVMSLAVDSRNTAALRLYGSTDFEEVFRRTVYVRR